MDLELKNKIALITGSSKGIGKAIAKSLNQEECKIILNGRTNTILKNTSKSLGENIDYFVADVSNNKSCLKLRDYIIKKYGKLDILVCNVGNGTSVSPGNETEKDWEKMLRINLTTTTNMIQTFKKLLSKSNGSITCISSIAGIETIDAPIAYATAKSALNTYVKQISRPLAEEKIRINVVVPGNIMFENSVWGGKLKKNPKKVKNFIKNQVPLKRFGKPEEIGDVVTFLSSAKASFITGSIFVIDGGQTRSF
jgi:3-oxoacyl-[acyl-carrier protein] reductase